MAFRLFRSHPLPAPWTVTRTLWILARIALAMVLVLYAVLGPEQFTLLMNTTQAHIPPLAYLDDDAHALPEKEAWGLEEELRALQHDWRLHVRIELRNDTLVNMMDQWAERRSNVVLAVDSRTHLLQVSIAPATRRVLPDAFVTALLGDTAQQRAMAADPLGTLRAVVATLRYRVRDESLKHPFDTTVAAFRRAHRDEPASSRFFVTQPTPDAAYRASLVWLAAEHGDPHATLFTDASQQALVKEHPSRTTLLIRLMHATNRHYHIVERGDLAMLYYTDTPLLPPMFFRRSQAGWQVDLAEEPRSLQTIDDEPYVWSFVDTGDDYGLRFADQFEEIGTVTRLAAGDNRQLQPR